MSGETLFAVIALIVVVAAVIYYQWHEHKKFMEHVTYIIEKYCYGIQTKDTSLMHECINMMCGICPDCKDECYINHNCPHCTKTCGMKRYLESRYGEVKEP